MRDKILSVLKSYNVNDLSSYKQFMETSMYNEEFKILLTTGSGMVGIDWMAGPILNSAVNLYEYAKQCARYMALYEMNVYYQAILLEISEDQSLSYDLRAAAKEVASYYGASVESVLATLENEYIENDINGVVDAIRVIIDNVAQTYVEKNVEGLVLKIGVAAAQKILKSLNLADLLQQGLVVSMDLLFDYSDIYNAYYNMKMASELEIAVRNIINRRIIYDYRDKDNLFEAEKYMHAIKLYQNVVLMGYDATIYYCEQNKEGLVGVFFQDEYFTQMMEDAIEKRKII